MATFKYLNHKAEIKKVKGGFFQVRIEIKGYSGTEYVYGSTVKSNERKLSDDIQNIYFEVCEILEAKGINLNPY